MKDFFKPIDFEGYWWCEDSEEASKHTNEILNTLIEQAPVVYFQKINGAFGEIRGDINELTKKSARLMFIEELVTEPCKHAPSGQKYGNGPWEFNTNKEGKIVCVDCGVELIADWKAK